MHAPTDLNIIFLTFPLEEKKNTTPKTRNQGENVTNVKNTQHYQLIKNKCCLQSHLYPLVAQFTNSTAPKLLVIL